MSSLAAKISPFAIAAIALLISLGVLSGAGAECYLFQLIALAAAIVFSLNTKKIFWLILLPLIVILSLYFPVGFNFGPITKGYVSAFLATDMAEAGDLLKSIPLWHFFIPAILIFSVIALKITTDRYKISLCSVHLFAAFSISLIFSCILFLFSGIDEERKLLGMSSRIMPFWRIIVFSILTLGSLAAAKKLIKNSRANFAIPILFSISALFCSYIAKDYHLPRKGIPYLIETIKENRLMQNTVQNNDWIVLSSKQNFRINLIIIGESVRRDYMHAYGYPVQNTDFMDSVPGVVFEGFTSEGDGTIESLRRVLTYSRPNGEKVNFSLNLIGLAKKAGMSTAWFSNQGFATDCDTPISAIASLAEQKRWLELSFAQKKLDSELLPLLKKEVARPDSRPKLIVLHLHGSHPSVCSSVPAERYKEKMKDAYYRESFCYVESLRDTDRLLGQAYQILKDSNSSFSMIYFADHGLSHNVIGNALTLKHSNPTRPHRDIPLLCASSSDTSHSHVRGKLFGDSFLEGVMNWLGITTQQIPNPRNIFTSVHDTDTHNYEKIWKSRRDDPPIDIREH